jgi:hypothetical protein
VRVRPCTSSFRARFFVGRQGLRRAGPDMCPLPAALPAHESHRQTDPQPHNRAAKSCPLSRVRPGTFSMRSPVCLQARCCMPLVRGPAHGIAWRRRHHDSAQPPDSRWPHASLAISPALPRAVGILGPELGHSNRLWTRTALAARVFARHRGRLHRAFASG